MDKNKEISRLLDLYLDGETTTEDEAVLRRYFTSAGDNVPEEWRPYRALFTFISEEKAEMAAAAEKLPQEEPKKVRRRHPLWLYIASTAASIAVILSIVLTQAERQKNYTVINGKVYTDKNLVREEALDALQMVSADEDDSFSALEMMK